MNKKTLMITAALVLGTALGFNALGGMSWLDSIGLRGPEGVLKQRIDSYWQARMDGDMDEMAQYVHPLQEELTQPGMLVTEAYEVRDISVEGENADAKIWVQSRLRHPQLSARTRETELSTNWVMYEGTWYRALNPSTITDSIKYSRGEWTPPQPGGATTEDGSSPEE